MVTGPMPRKPKATRPNAKTGDGSNAFDHHAEVGADAHASVTIVGGAHEADEDDAHPEGAEVTGGETGEDVERRAAFARRRDDLATWRDSVDVKTLMSSGMIAPASVPQVMMIESFHQSAGRRRGPG